MRQHGYIEYVEFTTWWERVNAELRALSVPPFLWTEINREKAIELYDLKRYHNEQPLDPVEMAISLVLSDPQIEAAIETLRRIGYTITRSGIMERS